MPFAKGTPKPANSGRKKGHGNRATVAAILDDLGCDPIEGMAKIAINEKTAFTLLVALGGSCIAFALIEWGTQAALRAGYHL